MKVITLWNPWAVLIADGEKKIETRSWQTTHRGPVAIHAAARSPIDKNFEFGFDLEDTRLRTDWTARLKDRSIATLGCIVAVADLVDCVRFTEDNLGQFDVDEHLYGFIFPGRWGWVLEDIRRVTPVKTTGFMGLWALPDEIESRLEYLP